MTTKIELSVEEMLSYTRHLKDLIDVKHELSIARHALLQAQNAAKDLLARDLMRGNTFGRISEALFGAANNVSDEACVTAVKRFARIVTAAKSLADEAQEYSFDDIGLGRGAPNSYWEDLDEALDQVDGEPQA